MDYIVAVRYESVKEARAQRGPLRQTQRHSSRRFEFSYLLSRQTPEGIGGKADESPPTAWAVSPPALAALGTAWLFAAAHRG